MKTRKSYCFFNLDQEMVCYSMAIQIIPLFYFIGGFSRLGTNIMWPDMCMYCTFYIEQIFLLC